MQPNPARRGRQLVPEGRDRQPNEPPLHGLTGSADGSVVCFSAQMCGGLAPTIG